MQRKLVSVLLSAILVLLQISSVRAEDLSSVFHPIMRPDKETLHQWIDEYENAPEAFIDRDIQQQLFRARMDSAGTSMSLLNYMQYIPEERDQGNCGNCWVWAGTGIVEIALGAGNGVRNRLSTQFLNSCKTDRYACCGGNLNFFRDWYSSAGYFVPWSNPNAFFFDANVDPSQCIGSNLSCGSISTNPNYPITSLSAVQRVSTAGVAPATAIANIKNVLNQNKGLYFSFSLANGQDWSSFQNFWNNQSESVLWNPDSFCGREWDYETGGGHAVLIAGYNDDDPDPAKHYWIVLNSWGSPAGRPNGLFRMPMYMNYECVAHEYGYPDWPIYQFSTFDITLQANTVSPSEGTIGTAFTITGGGFGTQKPTVYAELPGGKKAAAKVIAWSDSSVTSVWTKAVPAGTYSVFVKPKTRGAVTYSGGTFTIKNPGIDGAAPGSCVIGGQETISGDYFSTVKPKIYLENLSTYKRSSCKVSAFSMNSQTGESSLQFTVPKLTDLSTGQYRVVLKNKIGEATYNVCGGEPGGSLFNLTPYQPSGWAGRIVVSNVSGTTTDSTLNTGDSIYVDWAVINDGTAATSAGFYTDLYLDGVKIQSWHSDSLAPGYYAYINDFAISPLAAGAHTLRIVSDSTNSLSESSESDNEYTKTINVGAPLLVNLTPYQPSGWSDKIVVSNAGGTATDSTLNTGDSIYVDWAVINNGTAATSAGFYTDLYLDGTKIHTWNSEALPAGYYTFVNDFQISSLTAGTHTLRIVTDSTGVIDETNGSDNEYTKTINVTEAITGWTLVVVNNYYYPLTGLYISPSSSPTWGANWLTSPIASGSSRTIQNIAPGTYDLGTMASDGAWAERRGLVESAGQTFTWTLAP